jgi:hypothetical protein
MEGVCALLGQLPVVPSAAGQAGQLRLCTMQLSLVPCSLTVFPSSLCYTASWPQAGACRALAIRHECSAPYRSSRVSAACPEPIQAWQWAAQPRLEHNAFSGLCSCRSCLSHMGCHSAPPHCEVPPPLLHDASRAPVPHALQPSKKKQLQQSAPTQQKRMWTPCGTPSSSRQSAGRC